MRGLKALLLVTVGVGLMFAAYDVPTRAVSGWMEEGCRGYAANRGWEFHEYKAKALKSRLGSGAPTCKLRDADLDWHSIRMSEIDGKRNLVARTIPFAPVLLVVPALILRRFRRRSRHDDQSVSAQIVARCRDF